MLTSNRFFRSSIDLPEQITQTAWDLHRKPKSKDGTKKTAIKESRLTKDWIHIVQQKSDQIIKKKYI